MRLPTSDSKLFLFNEKKKRKKKKKHILSSCLDRKTGGQNKRRRKRRGEDSECAAMCVYARGHGFVHLCVQACLQYQRRCPVCTSTTPAHLVLLHKTVWGGFYVHITYVHQVVR